VASVMFGVKLLLDSSREFSTLRPLKVVNLWGTVYIAMPKRGLENQIDLFESFGGWQTNYLKI
jgi:hypothetical protein